MSANVKLAHEACPCWFDEAGGCRYRNGVSCHCVTHGLGHHKCGWPGHAAIDAAVREAEERGVMKQTAACLLHEHKQAERMRERAAHVAGTKWPRGGAHTYASENADRYHALEDASEVIATVIRALPLTEDDK